MVQSLPCPILGLVEALNLSQFQVSVTSTAPGTLMNGICKSRKAYVRFMIRLRLQSMTFDVQNETSNCQSTSRFAPRPLLADAQPTPPLPGWAAVPRAALRQPALWAPPLPRAARRGDLDITLTWVIHIINHHNSLSMSSMEI